MVMYHHWRHSFLGGWLEIFMGPACCQAKGIELEHTYITLHVLDFVDELSIQGLGGLGGEGWGEGGSDDGGRSAGAKAENHRKIGLKLDQ